MTILKEQLILDILDYRDQFGLTTLSPHENTQNGTLFTMEMLILMLESPVFTREEKLAEIERVKKVFATCERQPGLSIRNPGREEFDSMDNLTALLTFSALFDNGRFAQRMLDHGKAVECLGIENDHEKTENHKFYSLAKWWHGGKPKMFWNNINPQLFCFHSWYGRSPGFMSFLKLCTGKPINLSDTVLILIMQFLMGILRPKETDSFLLPFVAWYLLIRRGIVYRIAYKVWLLLLSMKYSNKMKDVFKIYFGDQNHPIHKLATTFSYREHIL